MHSSYCITVRWTIRANLASTALTTATATTYRIQTGASPTGATCVTCAPTTPMASASLASEPTPTATAPATTTSYRRRVPCPWPSTQTSSSRIHISWWCRRCGENSCTTTWRTRLRWPATSDRDSSAATLTLKTFIQSATPSRFQPTIPSTGSSMPDVRSTPGEHCVICATYRTGTSLIMYHSIPTFGAA